MSVEIKSFNGTLLAGHKIRMSALENKSRALWQGFMPVKKFVPNQTNDLLYSVEVYDDLSYFMAFDPAKAFDKWAAVEVSDFEPGTDNFLELVIPEGLYAVFLYKGKSSEAFKFYRYIFTEWIPASAYTLDDRPHFAQMGVRYKIDDADSEELIWIPITHR